MNLPDEIKNMNEEEALKALMDNKEAYNSLIDKRIEGEVVPNFLKKERKLNNRGILLRIKLGILSVGEAILCVQCNGIFGKTESEPNEYQACSEHASKEELSMAGAL